MAKQGGGDQRPLRLHFKHGGFLQQLRKFGYAQAGIPDYGAQRAGVQFPMVWNDHLSVGIIAAQNDVTAVLPPGIEADSGKGADAFSP